MNKQEFIDFLYSIYFDKVEVFTLVVNKEGKSITIDNRCRDRF